MNYIARRDVFLSSRTPVEPISEKFDMAGSGPMANDIEWGDSLLGRLLNSTMRKIKVGRDLLKVGGILTELEKAFEGILDQSKLRNSVTEEELTRVKIFYILRELKEMVYTGEELRILINFTENIIEDVKNKDNYVELSDDNRNELLRELEEFLAFLKSLLGDDEGKEDGEKEDDEKEDDEKADDKKDDSQESNKPSDTSVLIRKMIINLKSLYLIALNYKKLVNAEDADSRRRAYTNQDANQDANQNTNQNRNDNTGTTDTDQEPEQPIDTPPVTPSPAPASNPQPQTTSDGGGEAPSRNGEQLEFDFNESILYLESLLEALGSGASPERNKISRHEELLKAANKNLKKSMDELVGDRYKGIAVDSKYLNNLLIRANEKDNRLKIYKLYKEIHRYIIDDKEPTLQDKDSLYKESASVLLTNDNIIAVVAEKIGRVSKRLLQFDKQGLTGGMGDISKPMDDFISTMKFILENIEKTNPPKGLSENRTVIITKVSEFMKIYEDNEENTANVENERGESNNIEDRKASDLTKEQLKTLIIEKFEQIISYEKWVIKKVELEKIEKNLEDIEKGGTYNTELDMDNFMEVLKLFNRAYKIYTTPVIPSGRGGGKVSNKTFREYQLVGSEGRGSTPDQPGYGPWRNNAVFNKFESGVLDLLKNKKYQKIFEDKTIIRTGSGELVQGGGKILLSLINNLLDGDSLYKKGQQAKFISKYFNIGDIKEIDGREYMEGDREDVEEITENILEPKDAMFKKMDDLKAVERTFHVILEDNKQKYIFIYKVSNSKVYIKMTESIKTFKKYLYPNFKPTKGELDKLYTGTKAIYFGEISEGDFPITSGNTIDFKRLNISYFVKDSSRTVTKVSKMKDIQGIYSLVDKDGELVTLPSNKVTNAGTNDSANYNEMSRILNKTQ